MVLDGVVSGRTTPSGRAAMASYGGLEDYQHPYRQSALSWGQGDCVRRRRYALRLVLRHRTRCACTRAQRPMLATVSLVTPWWRATSVWIACLPRSRGLAEMTERPQNRAEQPGGGVETTAPCIVGGDTGPLFCFTLDTEPDDLWRQRGTPTLEHFIHLRAFHDLLTAAGARPTYLTTSEVVEDHAALRSLMSCVETGMCEVGAHFHAWTRQWPFPVPDLGSPPLHAMAHRLDPQVERAMLRYTCEALQRATGQAPQSYRGGRWSLGPQSVASLVACGVSVDTTVSPGQSWRDNGGPALLDGPDYTLAPREPYFLVSGEDVLTPRPSGEVLELPVGAAWTPAGARTLAGQRQLQRVMRKLSDLGAGCGYTWLRPTLQSEGQITRCLRQLKHDRVPVWVSIIHSSEIVPSHHLPTPEAVAAFVRRCIGMVETAIALGARPCTLQEARALVIGSGSPPA